MSARRVVTSPSQTIVCTAVPRGPGSRSSLQIGVHLSPRLSYTGSGATLRDFPAWLAWPTQSFTWQVSFNGGSTWVTPTTQTPIDVEESGELWRSILVPDLPVDSFTGSPGPQRSIFGYPYATLAEGLREVYTSEDLRRTQFGLAARTALATDPPPAYGVEPTSDVRTGVGQFVSFYRPVRNQQAERGELQPDFHERLALLGDHAPLLEKLRLVTLLTVRLPTEMPASSRIAARIVFAGRSTIRVLSPPTVATYSAAASIFRAARRSPATSEHDQDLRLRLDDPRAFSVHSIDVDATASQVVGAAVRTSETESVSPPAPTSTGLVLAQTARMVSLQRRVTSGHASATALLANPATPPDLFAEDLIVGHHVQVGTIVDGETRWLGVGHREVTYRAGGRGFTALEEAAVTLAARRADPADPTKLLVSDVLMRWDGWSIGVEQPGQMLLQEDPTTSSVDDTPGTPELAFLDISSSVPLVAADGSNGRLPILRYGFRYTLRARALDITGGSPTWSRAGTTAPTTYFRFDPCSVPLVLPPRDLTRGEQGLRLVVRSDPRSGQLPGPATLRTLVPPRVAVQVALQHGVFDVEGRPSAARYDLIAQLDERIPAGQGPSIGPDGQPQPLVVTWLPDPLTPEVRLDVDLGPDGVESRDVSFLPPTSTDGGLGDDSLGAWQSVALVLEGVVNGGDRVDQVDSNQPGQRIVRVKLTPGVTRTVSLRAQPPPSRMAAHGLVDWALEEPGDVIRAINDRGIATITPTQSLTIVHAVRRPMADPVINFATAARKPGQKDPKVTVGLGHHSDSTGRLAVLASWGEWEDDGARVRTDPRYAVPTRVSVTRSTVLDTEVALRPDSPVNIVEPTTTLVLPDLRRRILTLTTVATSRFVDEFRADQQPTFTKIPATVGGRFYLTLPREVDVESVVLTRGGSRLAPEVDYDVVAHPQLENRTVRLPLFVDPTGITAQWVVGTVLATSAARTLDVPSAVRPAPPKPLYAVPAFEVVRGQLTDAGLATAGRGGSRLRIWLERPWWSSGDEEQLAVITSHNRPPPALEQDEDRLAQLVTCYGLDPALRLEGRIERVQDTLTTGTRVTGLPLKEGRSTDPIASVYAHTVQYHAERDLYWAEIGLPAQPAGAFVRLAVARYQPVTASTPTGSVPKLSTVVTMDPVQLLPQRRVVVRKAGGSSLRAVVVGGAHAGFAANREPLIRMSLQLRSIDGAGADLGWDTVRSTTVERGRTAYPPITLRGPSGRGTYRLLFEEIERWPSRDARGTLVNPDYQRLLDAAADATDDLTGERITWVATTPLPRK